LVLLPFPEGLLSLCEALFRRVETCGGNAAGGGTLMSSTRPLRGAILSIGLIGFGGCVSVPSGPSVPVMPAPGKPFGQFAAEDNECRAYAAQAAGVTTNEVGAQNLVGSALVGSALGAITGAAIGGHNAAATGAGVGLATGAVVGTGLAGAAQASAQRRYDIAYEQCMYAKGNQLPSAPYYNPPGSVVVAPNTPGYPPAAYPPPPPP